MPVEAGKVPVHSVHHKIGPEGGRDRLENIGKGVNWRHLGQIVPTAGKRETHMDVCAEGLGSQWRVGKGRDHVRLKA